MSFIRYSILIPFWNLDICLLQRMLHSIPHRQDVEIIVLDNASDDIDKERLAALCDSNTRIIFQQERTTVGYCRNAMIEQARGEWIIFADADDKFFTEELDHVFDIVSGTERFDLIYWGMQSVHTNGYVLDDSYGYEGSEIQPLREKNLLMLHKYDSPRKMARRSLLLSHPEIRYDDIPIYEDVSYGVKLLLNAQSIGVYPRLVYQYIRRESSTLRQSWSADVIDKVFRHVVSVLHILKQNHLPVNEQEISRACLTRVKHASRWMFCRFLCFELWHFGWPLFYRDLFEAGFETFETNIFKAFINHFRVKIGGIIHKHKI